jgi:hypothetical protein
MSTAPPPLSDLSLVPLDRLVELLRQRVASSGLRLSDVLGHEVPPGTDINPGLLPESTIRRLAYVVEVQVGSVIPDRSELSVELAARRMSIGAQQIRLRRRRKIEYVCRQYLRLVYGLRDMAPGARFPVRTGDLQALAAATSIPFASVRTQLWREMEHLSLVDEPWARRVRDQLLLPTAGVAAAAVSFAGFEIARRASGPGVVVAGSTATAPAIGTPPVAFPADQSVPVVDTAGVSRRIVLPTVAEAPAQQSEGGPFPESDTPTPSPEPFSGRPQDPGAVGAAALELIAYDWATHLPGWTIEFQGEMPGRLGYAFFTEQRIEIYVRPHQTPKTVAEVIAHELGHAIDITLFETDDRETWLAARGIDNAPWWPAAGARSDFESGAGDWAEGFAQWLLDDVTQSELAGALSEDELSVVEELVYDGVDQAG